MPTTLTEVAAALTDLLQDGRAWDEDELVVALRERGVDLGTDPEDTVAEVLDSDDLPLVVPAGETGFALLPALLRGRTLTHRLSAVEVEHDAVVLGVDLAALWCLIDSETYRRLVDGTELVPAVRGLDDELLDERGVPADLPDDFVWLLPSGTLERTGLGVGDLVGFTVRAGGFELARAPEVPDAAGVGERLAEHLGLRGEGEPDEISEVVWDACAQDPEFLIGAVPPLAAALDAAGIACQGDFIARQGFDFARWRADKQVARVASLHRLEEDEALAVLVLTRLYDQVAGLLGTVQAAVDGGESLDDVLAEAAPQSEAAQPDGPKASPVEQAGARVGDLDPQLVRDLLPFLDDARVLSAILVETIGAGREGAAALGLFAETLEEQVPRSSRAALRWLRGMALERMGRVLEAEQAFEAALSLDGHHELTLYALARYAGDRGDAERGLSLLRRAGADPDDELVVLLTRFRPAERTDIGRNQPCWCGSGRKYKVCHRNRESLPLADRAAWLYQKAAAFLTDGPWREHILDVAEIRAAHWDGEGAIWQALTEGLASDLVLFEGGAFEEFVTERGVLLPDDERILADQWLLAERSVHEIESVVPGVGFTARDVRTGDRAEIRERTASRSLKAGELICARLVPAGDTVQIFGGLEMVSLRERDALIAMLDGGPRPEQLVALLSARFAPPQLENTEGEPLVMCEATLRCDDPAALIAHLDSTYDRAEGEPARWLEHVTTHGMERIRATLELTGADLLIETNSEGRLDRVLARVRELHPGLTLVAEARRPAGDVREAMSRSPLSAPGAALDPDGPELAAALTEFIRAQEQAWLDAPIPALSGATPREAAADPTRRPDLVRLLDTYDRPTAAGVVSMDPARLRSALGLG